MASLRGEHWLCREVVEAPSSEIPKSHLGTVLGDRSGWPCLSRGLVDDLLRSFPTSTSVLQSLMHLNITSQAWGPTIRRSIALRGRVPQPPKHCPTRRVPQPPKHCPTRRAPQPPKHHLSRKGSHHLLQHHPTRKGSPCPVKHHSTEKVSSPT